MRRTSGEAKIVSECLNCGIQFERHKCSIGNDPNSGKFCSIRCVHDWKIEHGLEQPKQRRVCKECGKIYYRYATSPTGKMFCSNKCRGQWRRKNIKGAAHPSWRGGQIDKKCIICGATFSVKKGREKIALYCSPTCHGEATRVRMSQNNPMLRKDVREQVGETLKHKWQNPEFREAHIGGSLKGITKRPTSLERQLILIIEREGLPYKYTGDGSFLIGWKNPDFVNVNGAKVCIEVANHFHHPDPWAENRKAHFAKYGWECYIFFSKDKIHLDEQQILSTLKGGATRT